jgi:signal transduction histidine kinase
MRTGRGAADIGRLRRWEAALDAAVLIAAVYEVVREVREASYEMLPVVLLVVIAAATRRTWPVASAAIAIVASALVLFEPAATIPVWVIAQTCLFTVALRCSRATTMMVGGIHASLLYAAAIAVFATHIFDPSVLILPAWTIAVVAVGMALRSNHDYVAALEDRARSAVAQRDADIARHIGEERLRIARDLHDSVAHTVSVVAVHAGAAERQLERDPARARNSLREVRSAARAVTDELQDILAVLRSLDIDDNSDAFIHAGGIPALIETAQRAGLHIDAALDPHDDIEPAVGVAAYRIVQESLTNALRYGNGEARVHITRTDKHLQIDVTNPVGVAANGDTIPGFGVLGMAERATSISGKVDARRIGQSFAVHAELPLHPREQTS